MFQVLYYYSGAVKPTDWEPSTVGRIACLPCRSQEAGPCCAMQGHTGKVQDHQEAQGEGQHGREPFLQFPQEEAGEAG